MSPSCPSPTGSPKPSATISKSLKEPSMSLKAGPLVAKALEDEGVRWTFGIPGTHNTELYDALEDSPIMPVLVTDEQSASFMADAVSRTSGTVGVANLVPAAGVTNAMSG